MASRNMQINLQFNANVQNARAQLQSLQTQLNNLINSNTTSTSLGITPQIQEATRSAMDLKIALNNAMNVNTGKLNLNKFQSELNRMGKDIGYFAQQMGRLGPEGVKAFTQVASAVAQADTKLFSLQGGMKKLANTFMNTVRWQLTSQAIMAVTSAVSETVSYAKELDTSLNNIRIVTGKSADQMATFAKEANNAAKALSTSTTKYTDASLIYYQQGLNDKAVKERTDVTVKLANVVGESAETVSEWMTAIWNNFDNGTEKLEYYADVLAKLGAATASSADEIAGGLEKFAAVADTIGLSYEYAASALATITAETRQSEDVVGTALKTILSRMEQLKQGDTLEDGTTLGQYSLALQKVGVDIKDASGELKDMDIILEQTGTRWETLGRDQQIALAQQVAGIRQYTQFMALMDNWDAMEKNLELTEQANGALTEQQRIYEESTKAAEERMKVASEAIKATLLGGDDMTKLYDIGAGALEIINELLEAFGGLPTILLAVASALTKIYQPQVASFLSQTALAGKDLWMNIRHPIKALKGENLSTGQQTRLKTLEEAKSLAMENSPTGTSNLIEAEFKVRERMVIAEKKMSESTRQQLEWELQTLDTQKEQVMLLGQQVEKESILASKAKAKVENKYNTDNNKINLSGIEVQANAQGAVQSHLNSALKIASQGQRLDDSTLDSTSRAQIGSALEEQIQKITKQANNLGENLNNIKGFDFLSSKVKDFAKDSTISLQEIIDLITRVQDALSQGVTSKPVIQDEVNNQIGIKKQSIQDSQSVVSSIDNLQGIKKVTSRDTADTALADIKKNLGSIKEDKLTSKDAKAKIKQWKEQANAIDKTKLSATEYKEKVNNLIADIKKHTNVQDKNNKTLRGSYNANKRLVEQNKDLSETEKQITEDLTKASDAMIQTAETNTDYEESLAGIIDSYEGLNAQLEYTGPSFQSFSNFFANGLSSLTSYAMGLSMLSSSVEQIGSSIAKGEGGLTNWISNISSLMLGIGMLIPAMTSMTAGIQGMTRAKLLENIATGAGVTLTGADTAAKEKNLKATLEDAKASGDLAAKKALEALSHAGAIVAQSWGAAIGVALMAVGLIAPIIGGISGFSSGAKEVKQEEVSKGTESLEAINENQELAESVTDLTEEYNALRNAGESTADVLEDMREKIPGLIESYKELAKTMGTHIDTSELEKAYEVFEKTGDTSLLEKAQEKIDTDIKSKEKTIAQSTIDNASDLVMGAAFKGQGHKDGKSYTYHMGDVGLSIAKEKQVQDIFAEELDSLWKKDSDGAGGQFTISDYENEGELIDAYNKMLAARDRLVEAGLDDTNYYKELNGEIKQMAESMPDLINAQQQLFDIQKEEALKDEQAFNSKIGLGSIGSVKEFEDNKDKIIAKIQEETEWTKAQAEAYLMATEAYGGYAEAADFFSKSGLGFNKDASKETIKDIKEWFADLPEEDRTLAMTIDYTSVATKEDAAAALEEARKKAEEAAILQEAEKLEVDEGTFDTYTEGLADLNKELDENENLTKQIALNNLKISKGLTTLTKSWDDNFEIIRRGNKASLEYAEAIGEVKKAFEEMFGVKPSTEYIEQYSNEINEMANGNLDSLQKLQDALAEDYILNMEFKSARNEEWSGTISEAQADLRAMLDSIDTSIEVGKNSTISGDLSQATQTMLDSVQGMLDAGVIAEEQLEELFRAKGYELNITGWDYIDGPEKTITRTTYKEGEEPVTVTETTKEKIKVPIINGDTDRIKVKAPTAEGITAGSLSYTKSTDKRVIDTSAAEEKADKKQDRLDSLKYEKDRYHEINEIISDTQRELDRLGKAKDRAFGASKLKLMVQEVAKQKELIKNNEELLKQAQEYAAADKKDLIANTASNLSIQFDEYGRIANYEELQNAYIKRLKNAAGNEELYDDISEEYDAFKDAAKKYEESLNKVEEQAEKVNDELDALYERNLEKIEYKVQIKVDIADDDKAYLDFLMQKIEDDAFAAAEAIANLGQQAEIVKAKINAANEGIAKIMADVNKQGFMTDKQAEDLRKYRDDLIDGNQTLLDIRESVQEKLTQAYDAWNEKLDKNAAKIKHLTSVTNSYKNIIDIVGKDTLGISDKAMAKLTDTQVNNANNALKASKAKLEANEAYLKDLQQKRANAVTKYGEDSDEVADWDKQIEYAEEQVMSAKEDFMGNWENALTAAADAFANHVDTIVENFSEAMGGIYKNLEQLQEAFGRQTEINDRYLQQYEKTYEINKLNRSIQDSIDKTDNVASQKELRKLQRELLAMQKDGVNVSQRDIEYMQKKYDLMVAEQALKDAQNAKSVVRLTRDSEGNFGYTYTADQATVDNAQQNYEDKLYAMQKFGDESLQEIQEQILATNTEFKEAMQAIANDSTLSLDEKKAKAAEITEYYTGKLNYWTGEAQKFMQHGQEMNTEYNAGMASNFNDTLLGKMYPDLTSFQDYYDQGMGAMTMAGSEFTLALEGYQGRIDTAFEYAGQDVKTFADDVAGEGGYLDQVNQKSDEAGTEAETLAERMKNALIGDEGATSAVESFYTNYAEYMEQVRQKTDDTISKVNELIQKYAELAEAAGMDYTPSNNSDSDAYTGSAGSSNTNNSSNGDGNSLGDTDLGLKTTITKFGGFNIKTKQFEYVQLSNGNWYQASLVKGKEVGDEVKGFAAWRVVDYKESGNKSLQQQNIEFGTTLTSKKGNKIQGFEPLNSYNDNAWSGTAGRGIAYKYDAVRYPSYGVDKNGNYKLFVKGDKYWYDITGLKTRAVNDNVFEFTVPAGSRRYKAFDTGGYTGAWGPEGRLALLHQKEIVLNAHDTENFLTAIGIVRDISDQIEKNAIVMQYQNQLANYRASIGNSGETLQQEVHITAEFPNATDHNEIEEAFKNLTNLASQYANRK